MNIRKLPSGNYQIRQMDNGITYTVTVDYKPTQAEAFRLIEEHKPKTAEKITLCEACEAYLDVKNNLLSKSTERSYRVLIRQIEPILAKTKICDITKSMIQAEVNRYSVGHAPKTVINFGTFLTTVLGFYGNKIEDIQYPQRKKVKKYIPTVEELKKILDDLNDTPFYVPVFLGSRGLRLSEVCALDLTDLSDNNVLSITKAKVQAEHGYVIKSTKTTGSERDIVIPEKIADRIRQQGYVYEGDPKIINRHLQESQRKLGITPFTFHQLRHFFPSYSHYQGIPDQAIQDDGGWITDRVMKGVYRQGMDREGYSKQISKLYESFL